MPLWPLVFGYTGRRRSLQRSCTLRAISMTSENGAAFGSRSMMHQSGCDSRPERLPHRCSGIVPEFARNISVSTSSQTKTSTSFRSSSLKKCSVRIQSGVNPGALTWKKDLP